MALRRVLTDPNAYSNATLNQTFVTTLLSFDPDTQLFSLSENLVIPPKVTNEPGKSRIWNDFTFQEIGKGDDFVTMETIVEKDPTNPQTMAPGIAPPHPYLSVEKATRVNQWVVERAEMDNDDEPEPDLSAPPQPDTPCETLPPPLAPIVKKPPGIRTRKAISTAKHQAAPQPTPEPAKASSPPPDPKKGTPTRKRWIMQYESGPEDRQINLLEDANTNNRSSSGNSAPIKTPNSPHGSSTTARPQTPENEPRLSINFDPTKYGLNKSPQHAAKSSFGSSASPTTGENLLMTPRRRLTKQSDLIDLMAPATPGSTGPHPLMLFDQPALVPQKTNGNDSLSVEHTASQELVLLNADNNSQDLLGLDFEGEAAPAVSDSILDAGLGLGSGSGPLVQIDQDRNQNPKGDTVSWQEQEKRLLDLKKSLREKKKEMSSVSGDTEDDDGDTPRKFSRLPKDQRQISMMLARQRLAELEKNHETVKKSSDETSTREFHRTMYHKTARPSEKKASKAEAKAKRQATLEDAWGIPKPAKEPPVEKLEGTDDNNNNNVKDRITATSEAKKNGRRAQLLKTETDAHRKTVKSVFEALRPALDAAEYFTGSLTLEIQLGLILIPLLPKTYNEGLISLEEWTKIFQPRNSLPAPTTKFINRLTTAGSDVDHIVDLKTSKADGKRHLFEQEYTEYNVSYEFHCRTTADKPFTIAVDEQGKHSIRKPATTLGAVNLHFPRQTWDASAVLGGIVEHIVGSDPELEEAVQHLVDNLWVQPDKSLVRIFSRLPKGNKFVIEKVFMKRWTRHRHIRSGDSTTPNANISGTRTSPENAPSPTPDTETQDIFLQITEVQDLLIGSSTSDSQALRARCAPLPEMHKKDRQWYEGSLVSPAIEAILKANANVELGERTDDWRSPDLLGKDAMLSSDNDIPASELGGDSGNGDTSMALSPPLSPVATAIGKAGLGELLALTKTVVEKIDGIGFFNYGPCVEAVRAASGGFGGFAGGTAPPNPSLNPLATPFTNKHPHPPPPPLPMPLQPAPSSALVLKPDQSYQQPLGKLLYEDLDGLDMNQVGSGSGPAPGPVTGVGGPVTGLNPLPLMERSSSTSSARMGLVQQAQQTQQAQQAQQAQQDELDYW